MANRPAKDPPTARPLAALDVVAGSVGDTEVPVSALFWELVSEDPVEPGPLGALCMRSQWDLTPTKTIHEKEKLTSYHRSQ